MCWTDVWCLTGAVTDSSPGEERRVFYNHWYFKVQVDEEALQCIVISSGETTSLMFHGVLYKKILHNIHK